MTRMIVFLFFVFGGFGLWGQQDPDRAARDASIKAERQKDLLRVAAETKKNLEDQANLIQESILRSEAAVKDSIARTEGAIQRSMSQTNTWGGGGRGGPLYHMPQDGAVELAKKVSSPQEILETGVSCVKDLAVTLGPKDAQKYCGNLAGKAYGATEDLGHNTQKAVKAPPMLIPRYW